MTLYIIIITVIISITAFTQPGIIDRFVFEPYMIRTHKQWYRYITSGLLHADYLHLAVNMYVLYSFGDDVEYYYGALFGKNGSLLFVLLYVLSIFASNVSTYVKYQHVPGYRSLGASGAVSAIIFACILFAPHKRMFFGLPGFIAGIGYLAYSHYMSKKAMDNINHEAHLYGAIFGILFTIVLKPEVVQLFIRQLF
jgi:membrane associated rhomboid family serine protease